MAYNYEYPYTDLDRFNVDWMIKLVKQLESDFELFVVMNEVKYAEPLQWSIDTQYTKNTIVQNNAGEATYLSKQPVPAGIDINNTDYWMKLADYAPDFTKLRTQLFATDLGSASVAPRNLQVDEIIWKDGYLWKVTQLIYSGYPVVANTNITPITLESMLVTLENLSATLDAQINGTGGIAERLTDAETDIDNLQTDMINTNNKIASPIEHITLLASDWVGANYTISDTKITLTSNQLVIPELNISPTQLTALQDANIQDGGQAVGSMTLVAFGNVPQVDIPVRVIFKGVK